MRAHLLDSDDPLTAGKDYEALCGQKVSKAEFLFCADSGNVTFSALLCCSRCLEAPQMERYLYGLIDGEKAKHMESEL